MALIDDFLAGLSESDFDKLKIANALSVLLDTTPYAKIRVDDLCQQAGISRSTFYRHFSSKSEIVQWYWFTNAQRYLLAVGRSQTWYESLLNNFKECADNVRFFALLTEERGNESVLEYGTRSRIESLEAEVRAATGADPTPEMLFQIRFFATAEAPLVGAYFRNNEDFNPEELARMVESCVPRELHDLLDGAVLAARAGE